MIILYLVPFVFVLAGCESVSNETPYESGATVVSSKTIQSNDLYVSSDVKEKHSKIWGVPSTQSSSMPSDVKNKVWGPQEDTMAYYYTEKQKRRMPEDKS